jgi:hypothetical protein
MRTLLKVTIPVAAGNSAIKDGSLPKTMDAMLDRLKPQSAYFLTENGKRNAYIFFDLKNASDIPSIAEPFFMGFDAEVDFKPVMDVAELRAGLQRAMTSV